MKAEAEPVRAVDHPGLGLREAFDLRDRLQRHPYEMVAGAVTIGFVLGGGLFTRLMARMVGSGLRIAVMVALPALEKQIMQALNGPNSDTTRENDQ